MSECVLCINAGSSSIKFQLLDAERGNELTLRLRGQIEGIGVKPRLSAMYANGTQLADDSLAGGMADVATAVPELLRWLGERLDGARPAVVGHRVVFGGTRQSRPVRIDDAILKQLRELVPFVPLHLPPELAAIDAIRARIPDMPQVAVFDTGFHRGHDEIIERLPLPDEYFQAGVRRYGYHGISYEFIASRLPEIAPEIADGRVVVAHLGSGCSMCAIRAGRSIESTMGLTALDGLPMGTRPGRLDPGAVLFLFQARKMSIEQVQALLYKECGLKGLSGISNDVRELLSSPDPRAKMALDYFALHSARLVAELAVVLGGIDGLVFTAGIGEHAAPVRADICRRLAWLGLDLDVAANDRHGPRISSDASRIACYVIPTNEELMIARHSLAELRRPG